MPKNNSFHPSKKKSQKKLHQKKSQKKQTQVSLNPINLTSFYAFLDSYTHIMHIPTNSSQRQNFVPYSTTPPPQKILFSFLLLTIFYLSIKEIRGSEINLALSRNENLLHQNDLYEDDSKFLSREEQFIKENSEIISKLAGVQSDSLESQLHEAALRGDIKNVNNILDRNVDINNQNLDGETPLFVAIRNGHIKVVRALLKKGANPNFISGYHQTPLYLAIRYANIEIIELLVSYEADLELLVNNNHKDAYYSPLGLSVHLRANHPEINKRQNFVGITKRLLELGAEIDGSDSARQTALHHACLPPMTNITDSMEVLLQHGANVNAQNNVRTTPLMMASSKGQLNLVLKLIYWGAETSLINNYHQTALQVAITPKIVETLKTFETIKQHFQENKFTEGQTEINDLEEDIKSHLEAPLLLAKAKALQASKKLSDAEKIFHKITKESPYHHQFQFETGEFYLFQQRWKDALPYLLQARKSQPENPAYQNAYNFVEICLNNKLTITYLKTAPNTIAFEKLPDINDSKYIKKEKLTSPFYSGKNFSSDNVKDAKKKFNTAIEFLNSQNYSRAKDILIELLKKIPDDPYFFHPLSEVHAFLGICELENKNFAAAINNLRIANRLSLPQNANFFRQYAAALKEVGETDTAFEAYKIAFNCEAMKFISTRLEKEKFTATIQPFTTHEINDLEYYIEPYIEALEKLTLTENYQSTTQNDAKTFHSLLTLIDFLLQNPTSDNLLYAEKYIEYAQKILSNSNMTESYRLWKEEVGKTGRTFAMPHEENPIRLLTVTQKKFQEATKILAKNTKIDIKNDTAEVLEQSSWMPYFGLLVVVLVTTWASNLYSQLRKKPNNLPNKIRQVKNKPSKPDDSYTKFLINLSADLLDLVSDHDNVLKFKLKEELELKNLGGYLGDDISKILAANSNIKTITIQPDIELILSSFEKLEISASSEKQLLIINSNKTINNFSETNFRNTILSLKQQLLIKSEQFIILSLVYKCNKISKDITALPSKFNKIKTEFLSFVENINNNIQYLENKRKKVIKDGSALEFDKSLKELINILYKEHEKYTNLSNLNNQELIEKKCDDFENIKDYIIKITEHITKSLQKNTMPNVTALKNLLLQAHNGLKAAPNDELGQLSNISVDKLSNELSDLSENSSVTYIEKIIFILESIPEAISATIEDALTDNEKFIASLSALKIELNPGFKHFSEKKISKASYAIPKIILSNGELKNSNNIKIPSPVVVEVKNTPVSCKVKPILEPTPMYDFNDEGYIKTKKVEPLKPTNQISNPLTEDNNLLGIQPHTQFIENHCNYLKNLSKLDNKENDTSISDAAFRRNIIYYLIRICEAIIQVCDMKNSLKNKIALQDIVQLRNFVKHGSLYNASSEKFQFLQKFSENFVKLLQEHWLPFIKNRKEFPGVLDLSNNTYFIKLNIHEKTPSIRLNLKNISKQLEVEGTVSKVCIELINSEQESDPIFSLHKNSLITSLMFIGMAAKNLRDNARYILKNLDDTKNDNFGYSEVLKNVIYNIFYTDEEKNKERQKKNKHHKKAQNTTTPFKPKKKHHVEFIKQLQIHGPYSAHAPAPLLNLLLKLDVINAIKILRRLNLKDALILCNEICDVASHKIESNELDNVKLLTLIGGYVNVLLPYIVKELEAEHRRELRELKDYGQVRVFADFLDVAGNEADRQNIETLTTYICNLAIPNVKTRAESTPEGYHFTEGFSFSFFAKNKHLLKNKGMKKYFESVEKTRNIKKADNNIENVIEFQTSLITK